LSGNHIQESNQTLWGSMVQPSGAIAKIDIFKSQNLFFIMVRKKATNNTYIKGADILISQKWNMYSLGVKHKTRRLIQF
jgi:hypothetical protein